MDKILWCVIGAGGIADRRTIPAILASDENVLVAVMDKNPEVAEKIGNKYGVPFYSNEEEMLKNHKVDAVYIGTPVACHYDQAMLALKYGANVFMEKPIAMNSEVGAELVSAFKKAGKQLTIGYMMKYHNLHKKAKSLVKRGGIGQVTDVRLQFSCWYPDIKGAWRQKKSLGGGGALMDLGVHCIELIEFVLGEEIVDVKGYTGTITFSYEVEDSAVMIFKTKSGALGHIDVNFNIPDSASESKMELYGTDGYIICKGTLGQEEVGTLQYLYAPQGDYSAMQTRAGAKPRKFKAQGNNIYQKQIEDFNSILKKGKPNYKYAERAVQVQKIVDTIYREG